MDGWNTTFLLGMPIFRGYVSFREGRGRSSIIYQAHVAKTAGIFNFICTKNHQRQNLFTLYAMICNNAIDNLIVYLGWSPSQVASDHPDSEPSLGDSNLNFSFATIASWEGGQLGQPKRPKRDFCDARGAKPRSCDATTAQTGRLQRRTKTMTKK